MESIIWGGLISVILAIVGYFVGRVKRYNLTLYCHETYDYRTVKTGTFSRKMTVLYDGKQVDEDLWCISRSFVNFERTDIQCKEHNICVKVSNGYWMDAQICNYTKALHHDDFSLKISEEKPDELYIYFTNLRFNEGFLLKGLIASRSAYIEVFHRIPDLNPVEIIEDEIHLSDIRRTTICLCVTSLIFLLVSAISLLFITDGVLLVNVILWALFPPSFILIKFIIHRYLIKKRITQIRRIEEEWSKCSQTNVHVIS